MYMIEKRDFGFKLTFGGLIVKSEMERWLRESQETLKNQHSPFGVFVDMRTLEPLPIDAQAAMIRGQQLYKRSGMERSVVILKDAITTMQFQRLAKESGIYKWERYIDASATPDWERVGMNWIVEGIEPGTNR